jgi:DNA primase
MPRDLGPIVRRLSRKSERPAWLDQVPAREMLEELGIDKITDASIDEMLFSCPFDGHAHGDIRPSAYMNNGAKNPHLNTVWKCHGCGRAGNAISFVAEFSEISRQRASRELRERYAPGWHKPRGGSMAAEWELRKASRAAIELDEHPEIVILDDTYYERFDVDWAHYHDNYIDNADVAYMFDRGFEVADLEEWRIGYDYESQRITIPVCTPDGKLLGFKGRAWDNDAKMKYRILGDTEKTIRRHGAVYGFAPYLKSQVVFGLDKCGEQDMLVWDEGEINVMSWRKMGVNAFATGSAAMSDAQAKIIRDFCDEVVMFVDPNMAGEHGMWGYEDNDGEWHPGAVEKLSPHVRVRIAAPHAQDANDLLRTGRVRQARRLVRDARPHWRVKAPIALL